MNNNNRCVVSFSMPDVVGNEEIIYADGETTDDIVERCRTIIHLRHGPIDQGPQSFTIKYDNHGSTHQ